MSFWPFVEQHFLTLAAHKVCFGFHFLKKLEKRKKNNIKTKTTIKTKQNK